MKKVATDELQNVSLGENSFAPTKKICTRERLGLSLEPRPSTQFFSQRFFPRLRKKLRGRPGFEARLDYSFYLQEESF